MQTLLTWKNEDKEGADSSDNTNDLADVWHEYGNEQGHRDPQHRHNIPAPPLQLRHCDAVTRTTPPQQVVLDYRPEEQQKESRQWFPDHLYTCNTQYF